MLVVPVCGQVNHKPVLHIVNMETGFQTAVFIENGKSADKLWEAFVKAWSSVYSRYQNKLHLDQESSFNSNEFMQKC